MQMAKYGIQRNEILARLTPLNTGWTPGLLEGKQFMIHSFCYCDNSWKRKEKWDCDYDKRYIYVVICDTHIPKRIATVNIRIDYLNLDTKNS